MMTVNEVSKLTGLSVRALHYYDQIGLLPPAQTSQSGYRLYDGAAIERIGEILFFRELEFPLRDIRAIVQSPSYDRRAALSQQIELLELKRRRLEKLIRLAQNAISKGGSIMDFKAFDKREQEAFRKEAKERWQKTGEYQAFEQKTAAYEQSDWDKANGALAESFRAFASLKAKGAAPDGAEAVRAAEALQSAITNNYYPCSKEILAGLGEMYVGDERFRENIDRMGEGTAEFAAAAIRAYCE